MILFVAAKYRDDGGKRSMDVTPVSAEGRERHTTPPVDELDILHRVVGDRTVLDHVNVDRHDHRSRWVEKRAFNLSRPSKFARAKVMTGSFHRIEPHFADRIEEKFSLMLVYPCTNAQDCT